MNYKDNRCIRVFISSTFRDMQDERDVLMKKTFPILRRKAAERDVTLTELDLRWGITEEESRTGKVVEICLKEIENSIPFFIGIIGNRYGWIPAKEDLDKHVFERFGCVDGYLDKHLSVTEMEMQFGVLERPEDLHAMFFIKDDATGSSDEPEKLSLLKKNVRANDRYPVYDYKTVEELSSQVMESFDKLLDDLFPEQHLTALEKDRYDRRAYLNSLCQSYIPDEDAFEKIDTWLSDWNRHELVISGESGLGKSSLIANWLKSKFNQEPQPFSIVYHFIGYGGNDGVQGNITSLLIEELKSIYQIELENADSSRDEEALFRVFSTISPRTEKKPLLIVFDAVNQLIDIASSSGNTKSLSWLPIPEGNIKIIYSTVPNDITFNSLKKREAQVIELTPLSEKQRRNIIEKYLSLYSKKLETQYAEKILKDHKCENTRALISLLEELVNFGWYEKLNWKIDQYLCKDSIPDFYDTLIESYERDYPVTENGWSTVTEWLGLLAVSRFGLSEDELIRASNTTPLCWSQFYCAFSSHLIIRDGLVSFSHGLIRDAVQRRYHIDTDYFLVNEDTGFPKYRMRNKPEKYWRSKVLNLLIDDNSQRAVMERATQHSVLSDDDLYDCLSDLNVFHILFENDRDYLYRYWFVLFSSDFYTPDGFIDDKIFISNDISVLSELERFSREHLQAGDTVFADRVNKIINKLWQKH